MKELTEQSAGVVGLGVDVSQILRFEMMSDEQLNKFAKKILVRSEYEFFLDSSDKPKCVCVYFSAKESVAKAIGTGFKGFGFSDIIIIRKQGEAPQVVLNENAESAAMKKGIKKVLLSVSHDGGLVFTAALALS